MFPPPFPRWHVNTSQRSMPPCRGQGSELRLASPQTSGPDRIFSRKRCRNPLEKHPLMHIIFLLVCLSAGNTPRVRGIFSSYSCCLSTRADQIHHCPRQTENNSHTQQHNQWGVNLNTRESFHWETAFN